MTTFGVVEHLDVVEDVTASFFAVGIDFAADGVGLGLFEHGLPFFCGAFPPGA